MFNDVNPGIVRLMMFNDFFGGDLGSWTQTGGAFCFANLVDAISSPRSSRHVAGLLKTVEVGLPEDRPSRRPAKELNTPKTS